MAAISRWTSALGVTALFAMLAAAERLRPLRHAVETGTRRVARNVSLAGIWFAVLAALQTPLLDAVTRWSAARHFGLLHLVVLPRALHVAVALLLFDYTLW